MQGDEIALFEFQHKDYLHRIGLTHDISPNLEGLISLTRHQLRTVPFENFEVLAGHPIDISLNAIWEKVITNKRGGYCFEVNALFLSVLTAFGFEARPLIARVHLSGTPGGRTHQISLVTMGDEKWLCDVGFGSFCLRAPLKFQLNNPQNQDGEFFRLISDADFGYVLQQLKEGEWLSLYSFTLDQVLQSDLEMGNYFTSTHPYSHFTKEGIAAIQTARGRITLRNYTLRIVNAGDEEVIQLQPGEDYLSALEKYFGISITADFSTMNMPAPEINR